MDDLNINSDLLTTKEMPIKEAINKAKEFDEALTKLHKEFHKHASLEEIEQTLERINKLREK